MIFVAGGEPILTPGEVKYLGCYVDTNNRDLDGYKGEFKETNSLDFCVEKCRTKGNFWNVILVDYIT